MGQPVRRPGPGGQEAARHLVLALGAAFKHGDLLLDAEFQRLVVGRLEVQAGHVFQLAPVAAVQRGLVVDDQRGRHRTALALGDHEQDVVRHGRADAPEEVQVQVGRGVVRLVGVAVAAVEQHPVGVPGIAPAHAAQADARLAHLAPLGADVLALLVLERGQEVLEAGVALVQPVELHPAAQHEAGLRQLVRLLLGRKQDVGRRHLARRLRRLEHLDQRRPGRRVARQQARAAHRREGNGGQQLRVIVQPMALVGVGPGPVEHVFAVGVALDVQGQGRRQGISLVEHDVLRLPARLRCGAARLVQRVQEGVG